MPIAGKGKQTLLPRTAFKQDLLCNIFSYVRIFLDMLFKGISDAFFGPKMLALLKKKYRQFLPYFIAL